MTRGTTTQTRTFNYTSGAAVGPYLLSATNPENGTVSYTYNTDGTQATKTDANGQQFTFGYDSYKRPTTVSMGGSVIRTYIYDNNSLDATGQFSQYGQGRLVAIRHAGTVNSNGITGFIEMFSYTQPGSIAAKRLRVTKIFQFPPSSGQNVSVSGDLDTTYAYDTEGKTTTVGYPAVIGGAGPSYTYSFDSLGRPNGLVDNASNAVVSAVQYGPANEMLQMSMLGIGTERRKYNSRLQLTNISIPGQIDLTYTFDTNLHNDGKIASQKDAISGEQVSYLYDSLSRLSSATGSGWSQSYQYDGFGNLLARVATGTAPGSSFPVDPATNRLSQYAYDNNGNLLSVGYQYDAENRLVQANGGGAQYFYDAQNKRIWQGNYTRDDTSATWNFVSEVFNVYGANGQMLGSYQAQIGYLGSRPNSLTFYQSSARVYFGRKLIAKQDRLGSVGKYFPYGEERNSPPLTNDQVKFATYTRDSATGLDYADQRYYGFYSGRFLTADPYRASAQSSDPGSWNRYAYVGNDPVNFRDPSGLDRSYVGSFSCTVGEGEYQQTTICDVYADSGGAGDGEDGARKRDVNQIMYEKKVETVYKRLPKAIQDAYNALANPRCNALFSSALDSQQVLQALTAGNTGLGYITIDDIPSDPGQVTSATTTALFSAVSIGQGATQLQVTGALVAINDLAGTFIHGSDQDRAVTILHELGHVFYDLLGLGGSQILPDGNGIPDNVNQSMRNTSLIEQDCFGKKP
jgi:RHS repeat-associated protein